MRIYYIPNLISFISYIYTHTYTHTHTHTYIYIYIWRKVRYFGRSDKMRWKINRKSGYSKNTNNGFSSEYVVLIY